MRIIETAKLKTLGMNLMVSVGAASVAANSSRLVILENITPESVPNPNPKYVLIGKGVMFDTGGTNLKVRDSDLYQEKTDMAGAAIIASFMMGYAKLGGTTPMIGLLALTQNDIGASGTHPGDVITSYNGMTVEIIDTDAEGRLLLADCLAYAEDKYPKATLIDIATLTGDQAYMSCKMFSSGISRHPSLIAKLVESGNIIQERIVESPYMEEFRKYLDSAIADIKNIGDVACQSDMLMAGVFLGQFIKPSTPWIHLDIAGTSYGMDEVKPYYPEEGSAIGVRLLFEFTHSGTHLRSHSRTKSIKKH